MRIPLLDIHISLESGKSKRARDEKRKKDKEIAAALISKILDEKLRVIQRLKRWES